MTVRCRSPARVLLSPAVGGRRRHPLPPAAPGDHPPQPHDRRPLIESSSGSRQRYRSAVFMNFDGSQSSTPVLGPEPAFGPMLPDSALIVSFLEEQGDLTAVERFTQFHEDADEPLQ